MPYLAFNSCVHSIYCMSSPALHFKLHSYHTAYISQVQSILFFYRKHTRSTQKCQHQSIPIFCERLISTMVTETRFGRNQARARNPISHNPTWKQTRQGAVVEGLESGVRKGKGGRGGGGTDRKVVCQSHIDLTLLVFFCVPSYISGVHLSSSSSAFRSYISGVHLSSSSSSAFPSYISRVHHSSSSSAFPAISLGFTFLLLLRSQLYLWGSPFFFFFCLPQLYLWGSPFFFFCVPQIYL